MKTCHTPTNDRLMEDAPDDSTSSQPKSRRYQRRCGETHFQLLRPAVLAAIASSADDISDDNGTSYPSTTYTLTSVTDGGEMTSSCPPSASSSPNSNQALKRCRRVSYPRADSETLDEVEASVELLVAMEELHCDYGESPAGPTKRRVSMYHDD
ncbi:hypothetical protein MPSEU_001047700 [Mayamaea pseudoterrestris]|nr:hypothetical protein MPSEU_001047700 [Mayamaea pseudoterrestris]